MWILAPEQTCRP